MIVPSATDILRCIEHTLEKTIKPALADVPERSAAQTMGHLLRHVVVKVEHEGQMLTDEAHTLRQLLAQIRNYFDALTPTADAQKTIADIDETLKQRFREEDQYPTLTSLAEETGALREALYTSLRLLQSIRNTYGEEAEYTALRSSIRAYMSQQIQKESELLIEPAFVGYGPRR